jgi:hypothetical protein
LGFERAVGGVAFFWFPGCAVDTMDYWGGAILMGCVITNNC